MTHTWPEVISALVARQDLAPSQTAWAMGQIVAGAGEAPGFVTAWIEHARLDEVRAKNPSLANRRFGVRVPGDDGC